MAPLPNSTRRTDAKIFLITIIEYEGARAYPGLEHDPDVSIGLRNAVARGRLIDDPADRDAYAARDRFWAAAAQADALVFPAAPDVAPAGMHIAHKLEPDRVRPD